MKYTIIFPLPPTDNQRLRPRRGRLVPTQQYMDWKDQCAIVWRKFESTLEAEGLAIELDTPTYEEQLSYPYRVYMKDLRSDAANFAKCARDILKGRVYDDDKYAHLAIELPVKLAKDAEKQPSIEIDLAPTKYKQDVL
jgi:Holliday junction resolvase RusA-like endonuclease